jgi:hypothetical protein
MRTAERAWSSWPPRVPRDVEFLPEGSPMTRKLVKGARELSEETAVYMSAPDRNGTPALPKREGPKGLLPSTWIKRVLRLEYVVCGELRHTEGTLLDIYPAGPVLNCKGARTLIAWDTLAVVELVGD